MEHPQSPLEQKTENSSSFVSCKQVIEERYGLSVTKFLANNTLWK
jgi:hypothetical protein